MLMSSQAIIPTQFHQQQMSQQPFCAADSPVFEPFQHQQTGIGGGPMNMNGQHQAQSLLFSSSGAISRSQPFQPPPGVGAFVAPQQPPQQNGKTTQQQMMAGAMNGAGAPMGGHQQPPPPPMPGAWFFPPAMSQQQGGATAADLEPASSPGLMPGQLLARFGPRHCTESVEVPSSEHVAEIVGRQGCKIKALRAKTNTYIKTPVRGEEPVFVVTGRQEDVAEARREIECAAEHFTQIRASRRHSQGGCPAPGHVTAYVRVPLRVVGLVVGPKGNTIKRIQQDTHTYIITPSREREPIFEVTGLPQNVAAARREIEHHIYQRTGNMPITDQNASIADYNLHAAALHAQQSALHQSGGQRPNYGALAVSTRNLISPSPFHPQGGVGGIHQQSFHQQHHQQQNGGGGHFDAFGVGGGQHFPAMGGSKLMAGFCGGSERGGPSPANTFGAQQQLLQHQQQTAVSTNNLHMLLNAALELDGPGQQQQQHKPHPFGGPQLLRSISNNNASGRGPPMAGHQPQHQQQQQSRLFQNGANGTGNMLASAFSPWPPMVNGSDTAPGGAVDFLDLITSSSVTAANSPSPLLFSASSNGTGIGMGQHFSSSSTARSGANGTAGNAPGTNAAGGVGAMPTGHVGGGLSSVNSSSRDEGLGDSPTNSFGRPNGTDYQYQHLMTIWADLVDQPPPSSTEMTKGEMEQQQQQGEQEKQQENAEQLAGGK